MVVTSPNSSSSSSAASFSSFEKVAAKTITTVKFVCSYGGRILPLNGKLRYIGGETRVLAVERCLPFTELQVKLAQLCGCRHVSLRCQLPTDDLDTLISVTSDEDLTNLYEEYDLAGRDPMHPIKIRAFQFPSLVIKIQENPKPTTRPPEPVVAQRCFLQFPAPSRLSVDGTAGYPSSPHRHDWPSHVSPRRQQYLVHHGNHRQ